MKRSKKLIAIALLISSAFVSHVFADAADHTRMLPDFSNMKFDVNNIYFGLEVPVALPVGFTGNQKIAGLGAGAAFEAGYDWDGWLLGMHTEWRTNTDNGNAFKSLNNTFITLDVSKLWGTALLPFMPEFMDLRTSFGIGLDIINANYYPTAEFKANNALVNATECAMVYNFGLEFEYNQLDKIIPYAGLDIDLSGDKKGMFVHSSVNVGVRTTLDRLTGPHNGNPGVTIRPVRSMFTPDGDGTDDVMKFKINTKYQKGAEPKTWKVEIYEDLGEKKSLVKTYSGEGVPPKTLVWNGESDKKKFTPTSASEFKVYVTVDDSLGNTNTQETTVNIGILVEKLEDGSLRILVNSIKFDANKATFDTLSRKDKASNDNTIKMIAKSLKKFKQYNVVVEGHAHNVSGTVEEENDELIPLSKERANVIMNILIDEGVPSSTLSAVGKGGKEPISTEPAKNRRVEFKLAR